VGKEVGDGAAVEGQGRMRARSGRRTRRAEDVEADEDVDVGHRAQLTESIRRRISRGAGLKR
jgi:hypothetical protein